jgi:ABC-type metal ion transport system substrate-binding protein
VGLIKLKDGVGLLPTALDVIENPKNLKLVELEAPQLPRSHWTMHKSHWRSSTPPTPARSA